MKIVNNATTSSKEFAKCSSAVTMMAGKSCDNLRDLPCGKNTR